MSINRIPALLHECHITNQSDVEFYTPCYNENFYLIGFHSKLSFICHITAAINFRCIIELFERLKNNYALDFRMMKFTLKGGCSLSLAKTDFEYSVDQFFKSYFNKHSDYTVEYNDYLINSTILQNGISFFTSDGSIKTHPYNQELESTQRKCIKLSKNISLKRHSCNFTFSEHIKKTNYSYVFDGELLISNTRTLATPPFSNSIILAGSHKSGVLFMARLFDLNDPTSIDQLTNFFKQHKINISEVHFSLIGGWGPKKLLISHGTAILQLLLTEGADANYIDIYNCPEENISAYGVLISCKTNQFIIRNKANSEQTKRCEEHTLAIGRYLMTTIPELIEIKKKYTKKYPNICPFTDIKLIQAYDDILTNSKSISLHLNLSDFNLVSYNKNTQSLKNKASSLSDSNYDNYNFSLLPSRGNQLPDFYYEID
ncbi:MAG: hypothetical protein WDZ28_02835 [Simkaniaceae bacterium]